MSKKVLFCLFAAFNLIATQALAAECFILQEGDTSLIQEGRCDNRSAPACSFNIAIALMAVNEGVISDTQHPVIDFHEGHDDALEKWRQPHNPSTWMTNSCLWYSKEITQRIGQTAFEQYLHLFHYGNEDGQGIAGQRGVDGAWLSSSLQISPTEQIHFIQAVLAQQLPVSQDAYHITRNIIRLKTLENGWTIYGKTGAARRQDMGEITDQTPLVGWFVGWAERDQRRITFAYRVEDETLIQGDFPSTRAKEKTLSHLNQLLGTV